MLKKLEACRLTLKVAPKSSKTGLFYDKNGELKLFLNSPPVDGEANRECIAFLSKFFHVPKTSISIIAGEKSKIKTFEFSTISAGQLEKNIQEIKI